MEQISMFNSMTEKELAKALVLEQKGKKNIFLQDETFIYEGNWIELPIFSLSNKFSSNTKEVIREWTDSKNIKRGIKIRQGLQEYGLPTINDSDTLVSIFKVNAKDNPNILFNDPLSTYIMDNKIYFTKREVAKELGYNSYGGSADKRIVDSIKTLYGTFLMSLHAGAFYDPKYNEYIIETRDKGFRIVDDYDFYKRAVVKKGKTLDEIVSQYKEQNWIKINDFFYNSLKNGYFKILNHEVYKQLRSGPAKRIFMLAEKWRVSRRHYQFFTYDMLYQRIPLENSLQTKTKNKYIREAGEELLNSNYIKGCIPDQKRKGIYLIFKDDLTIDEIEQNEMYLFYRLDKYNSDEEILKALYENDITEEEIRTYVESNNKEYIKALLRYTDIYVKYNKITEGNPKGFILKGLKKPYDIDKKYFNGK